MGPRSEMNCAGTTQTEELKVGGRKAGCGWWVAEVISQHGERTWDSFQRGRGWLGGEYSPDNIVRAWAPWGRKGWGFSYDLNVVQNWEAFTKNMWFLIVLLIHPMILWKHCHRAFVLALMWPGTAGGNTIKVKQTPWHPLVGASPCTSWWLKMPTALIWFSSQSIRGLIGGAWSIGGILQADVEPLQWDIQQQGRCHLCKGGFEQKAKRTSCWEVTKGHRGKKTAVNGDEEGMKGLFVWRKSRRAESRKDIFFFPCQMHRTADQLVPWDRESPWPLWTTQNFLKDVSVIFSCRAVFRNQNIQTHPIEEACQ